MNTDHLDEALPPALERLVRQIEVYCGFEIQMVHEPLLHTRGALLHDPSSIVLRFKRYPVCLAVLAHELCHARRYFVQRIPFFEFLPERVIQVAGRQESAATHLDNLLEHLVILQEMNDELGFAKDHTHVANDLEACESGIADAFTRKCTLLTNWLLASHHFPPYVERYRALLGNDHLLEKGESLLSDVHRAGTSKAKTIAALVRSLGIDLGEIRLRYRNPTLRCDDGAMLPDVLAEEQSKT